MRLNETNINLIIINRCKAEKWSINVNNYNTMNKMIQNSNGLFLFIEYFTFRM